MGGLVKDPCPAGIRTELKIKTCKNLDAVEPQRSERMFEGYVIDAGWPNGLPRPPRPGGMPGGRGALRTLRGSPTFRERIEVACSGQATSGRSSIGLDATFMHRRAFFDERSSTGTVSFVKRSGRTRRAIASAVNVAVLRATSSASDGV